MKDKILKLIKTSKNGYELADRICELVKKREANLKNILQKSSWGLKKNKKLIFAQVLYPDGKKEHVVMGELTKHSIKAILDSLNSDAEKEKKLSRNT